MQYLLPALVDVLQLGVGAVFLCLFLLVPPPVQDVEVVSEEVQNRYRQALVHLALFQVFRGLRRLCRLAFLALVLFKDLISHC